jgi:hypothetical protein
LTGNELRVEDGAVATSLPCDSCKTVPDLTEIIDAWAKLPDALKAGIVAMVRAARK